MIVFTERDGSLWIETKREGLLAPVGHDLRLEARRFRVEISADRQSVKATIESSSVAVKSALVRTMERPGALGRIERRRIEHKIAQEVLAAPRFPVIEFLCDTLSETATGYTLAGRLSVHGATNTITLHVDRSGARLRSRAVVRLSDFGIRPVTAFLGTLRVRDEVSVVVDLPDLT
jgi:polyisoprenoid-binding protein YceI